jgi:hypothetical protein
VTEDQPIADWEREFLIREAIKKAGDRDVQWLVDRLDAAAREARNAVEELTEEAKRLRSDRRADAFEAWAARREGICGAEFGQHGIICELTHGHLSAWHEAPNEIGPPMRWKPSTVAFNLTGMFDAAGDVP